MPILSDSRMQASIALCASLMALLPFAAAAVASQAKLPALLVVLEQRMRALHIDTERGTVVGSVSGLRVGGDGSLFESAPRKRSRQASEVELESDALLRLPFAPPLSIPLVTADFESSVSPRLAIVRAEILGVLPFQVRLIGELTYVRSPLVDLLELGGQHPLKPWISEREAERAKEPPGKKGEAASPLPSVGEPEAGFGKLLASLAKARSIVEVGPAVVDGQQTTEFRAKLEQGRGKRREQQTRERHKGSGPKRLRETLYLYLASDGLPVRATEQAQIGKARLNVTVDILETEIPVSVQPPPASETITKAELEEQEKEAGSGSTHLSKREKEEARRFNACLKKHLPKHPRRVGGRKLRRTLRKCLRIAKRGSGRSAGKVSSSAAHFT